MTYLPKGNFTQFYDAALFAAWSRSEDPSPKPEGWHALDLTKLENFGLAAKNIAENDKAMFRTTGSTFVDTATARVFVKGSNVVVAFTGTDEVLDALDYYRLMFGDKYIKLYSPLLMALEQYFASNHIHYEFVGHSLGGGAVNQLASNLDEFKGFDGADFYTFASPLVTKGVINFGFRDDGVYHIIPKPLNYPPESTEHTYVINEPKDAFLVKHNYSVSNHLLDSSYIASLATLMHSKSPVMQHVNFQSTLLIVNTEQHVVINEAFATWGTVNVIGSDKNQIITGTSSTDRIDGGNGNDSIDAGYGADTVYGGQGVDTIHGGPGDDFINGGLKSDVLDGGPGSDIYYSAGVADKVNDTGSSADEFDHLNFTYSTINLNDSTGIEVYSSFGAQIVNVTADVDKLGSNAIFNDKDVSTTLGPFAHTFFNLFGGGGTITLNYGAPTNSDGQGITAHNAIKISCGSGVDVVTVNSTDPLPTNVFDYFDLRLANFDKDNDILDVSSFHPDQVFGTEDDLYSYIYQTSAPLGPHKFIYMNAGFVYYWSTTVYRGGDNSIHVTHGAQAEIADLPDWSGTATDWLVT